MAWIQNMVIILIVASLIGGFVIYGFGNDEFSIIGQGSDEPTIVGERGVGVIEYPELTCSTDQDCYDKAISSGFPKAELDEQLKTTDLFCGEENYCIAREK